MNLIETTFLIVGGGISGVSCTETLSFLCPEQSILLLTESSLIKAVTNLVPLGKALTRFEVEEKDEKSFQNNVQILTDRLISINSSEKFILTENNKQIKFNYLCLCTGARPKLIEMENPFIIGIRDTESVLDFQQKIKNGKKLVIIGNGGIASEIVFEVKNIEIDWIIKDNHISSTFVDPGASQFFQNSFNKNSENSEKSLIKRMRYFEEKSETNSKKGAALGPDWQRLLNITGDVKDLPTTTKIHYECEIKSIKQQKDSKFPLLIELSNGESINCDFVVSATGVIPEINFNCDRAFKLGPDGGLLIDEMMKTSINGIYAAGDICFAGWEWAKHWFQMRLWTQARQMGMMAGKSMAADFNKEEIYQDFCFELFGHVTKLFGYQVVLLGNYNAQGYGKNYEALVRITPDKEYIKYVIVDGKLQGAILIGETGLEETSENLILNQLDITPFGDDLLNPNIDIEDFFD